MTTWMGLCVVAAAATPTPAQTDSLREAAEMVMRAAEASEATAQRLSELSRLLQPPAAKDPEHWSFNTSLRLEWVGGNARSFTAGLDGTAEGQWGDWGTELKLGYAQGRTRTAPIPVADNGSVSARGDRDFTGLLSAYLLLGGLFDHVASIHHQAYSEAGVGLTWLNRQVENIVYHRVRTGVGFRVTQEGRRNFYPTLQPGSAALEQHWIYAPSLSLSYRYRLNRHVYLSEDASAQLDVEHRRNLRGTSDTGLNVQLNDLLTIALVGKLRYIGQPAAGRRRVDSTVGTTVSFAW